VLLSNSAKTLTCRTYEIYAYDPLTGETKQITNLRDADEYNPSWSPNGKWVAHDVVGTDGSHGIYVTNVRTGVSVPLTGAEDGGNDAVWSPNGQWIVFDRRWYDDASLYILPPQGGERNLVVSDAVSAAWSPNSQRLVFHRPSDGSIRTVGLTGSAETLVVARGENPVWSPNGLWIAYEFEGNIWKVRVNIHGVSLGEPIQVTTGGSQDGGATWSANSKTIAFHSGIGGDWDIWTIPAAGGMATWLTGAPGFGDYDPAYSNNGRYIAYASFSPAGQAARLWFSAYTYDAGTWSEGTHTYHYEAEWNGGSETTPELSFNVSGGAQRYDGYALLRPFAVRVAPECQAIDTIHPDQPTRFLSVYVTDYDVDYQGALAFFDSLTARAVWDDGQSAELARHEIIPFRPDDWFQYVCTFTEAPPKMDLRVNYGHDWVESFYEAGHEVVITVTDSDGVEKAAATVFTEPKDFWGGETGFQTRPEDWVPAPPDIQPYDWVYAQVDNGATAQVQLGDIHGEVRFDLDSITGTIEASWLTDPVRVECLDWGSGGEPINKEGGSVLTNGAEYYSCGWDPETEWDVQPWQDIGVGYFTPDGHWVANAFRDERWMAMWTYDLEPGFWAEGEYSYYFQWAYTIPELVEGTSGPLAMTVSIASDGGETPVYPGYVLIEPWISAPQLAWTGSSCEAVPVVHPAQPTRFVWGWVNDYSMTYEEALDHFTSFTVQADWEGESAGSADLVMGELLPFTSRDARWEYRCTLTEHP
jgi:Tol biopolymer transport system component